MTHPTACKGPNLSLRQCSCYCRAVYTISDVASNPPAASDPHEAPILCWQNNSSYKTTARRTIWSSVPPAMGSHGMHTSNQTGITAFCRNQWQSALIWYAIQPPFCYCFASGTPCCTHASIACQQDSSKKTSNLFALQVRETMMLHMPDSLPAWAAHSECQEVWAGPSWSSYQQCIEGAQLTSRIMLRFA
jgi:hypothetical protein